MRLYDVLEMFDENKKMNVWDCGEPDNLLTFYDGRNSIGMIYNYCEVTGISTHFDEYDNETVLDIYIKQDEKSSCLNDIAEYIRIEFDIDESQIAKALEQNIVSLGYTTSSIEGCENVELVAMYNVRKQALILQGGENRQERPVKYQDVNEYLDFDYLVSLCDDLVKS